MAEHIPPISDEGVRVAETFLMTAASDQGFLRAVTNEGRPKQAAIKNLDRELQNRNDWRAGFLRRLIQVIAITAQSRERRDAALAVLTHAEGNNTNLNNFGLALLEADPASALDAYVSAIGQQTETGYSMHQLLTLGIALAPHIQDPSRTQGMVDAWIEFSRKISASQHEMPYGARSRIAQVVQTLTNHQAPQVIAQVEAPIIPTRISREVKPTPSPKIERPPRAKRPPIQSLVLSLALDGQMQTKAEDRAPLTILKTASQIAAEINNSGVLGEGRKVTIDTVRSAIVHLIGYGELEPLPLEPTIDYPALDAAVLSIRLSGVIGREEIAERLREMGFEEARETTVRKSLKRLHDSGAIQRTIDEAIASIRTRGIFDHEETARILREEFGYEIANASTVKLSIARQLREGNISSAKGRKH